MNQPALFWLPVKPHQRFPLPKALVAAGADVWSIRVSEGEMKRLAGHFGEMNPAPPQDGTFGDQKKPSSHSHGSGKSVPPMLHSFYLGWFSTSMIMGEMDQKW